MAHVKVVMFDIGNVIVQADHALTHRYLCEKGIPVERAELFYQIDAYPAFARGWMTPGEFANSLRLALEVDWSDEELQAAHDIHLYKVDEQVLNLVAAIKLPIAIATDTNYWQTRREQELIDVTDFSMAVFRSHVIGLLKRDKGTFDVFVEHFETRFNTAPENIVLVDDMPDICAIASSAGLQTICFQNAGQLEAELITKGVIK